MRTLTNVKITSIGPVYDISPVQQHIHIGTHCMHETCTRPATRYGRCIVFEGGWLLRISQWQRFLYWAGFKKTARLG